MKATNKIELKTKDGRIFPAGVQFDVYMKSDLYAVADPLDGTKPVILGSLRLGKYFKGFVKFKNIKKYMKNEGYDCCAVPSLTGERVEPDGEDEHGFPSVLRAAGYI